MKGISQIVAVILMLMIGVSMVGVLFVWSQNTVLDIYPEEETEAQYLRQRACIGIQGVVHGINGDNVTVNNCGSVPLDDIKVFVNDEVVSQKIDPIKFNPSTNQNITVVDPIRVGDRIYVTSDLAISPVLVYQTP
ncbi:MAG: hypothetical protein KJ906_03725 [Nanoarchaeota archaeon]|nr:hypothetical protein [Nanoarchaeota archaeon]